MSGNGHAPPSSVPPPGALPVHLIVSGKPVHIGWVLTLGDLPDLLDDISAKLRGMTEEAQRGHAGH